MTSTVQDAIRDQIADVRFSRRKLASPCFDKSGPTREEEQAYHDSCLQRIRWLFASRHQIKPNRYGWYE